MRPADTPAGRGPMSFGDLPPLSGDAPAADRDGEALAGHGPAVGDEGAAAAGQASAAPDPASRVGHRPGAGGGPAGGGHGPDDDDVAAHIADIASLATASTVDDVLRAAVVAACGLTGSRRGLAAVFDGQAAVSDAWFDAEAGWTRRRRLWRNGEGGIGEVLGSASPLLLNDVAANAGGRAAEDIPGVGRLVCAPLADERGATLGLLAAGGRESEYTDRDCDALAAVCRLAAQRLRDATSDRRRAIEEHAALADIAERLQAKLLPGEPPRLAGLDVAFAYRSASAGVLSGGDFVDYYTRSPGMLAFAIGDVAGKGVDAMAVTFVTKYVLRAAVHGGQLSWPTNPGEALQELRTALLEQADFSGDGERFVTVLFGLLNPRRGLLQLASAGHPTPFLVRAEGVERPLLLTEPAIGVELGAALAPYPTEVVELRRGDVLVLFTDGIAELRDAQGAFFEQQMDDVLRGCHDTPAAAVVERLMAAGEAFSARPPSDDLALLCLHLTAEPAVH